ncbi:DUF1482 family protein [Escherichia coli]|nr:DUF1482 family protein [Escherichia coli]
MTSAFALMMTVFLITGESQNVITGIYASKESCLPVKKVSLYLNNETPAG